MHILVRHRQAERHRIHPQHLLEDRRDRNRAPSPRRIRALPMHTLQHPQRRAQHRVVLIQRIRRRPARLRRQLQLNPRRHLRHQMRPQRRLRPPGVHPRRQPHGDLGMRLRRQHRLGPRPLVAAPHPVDLDRRPHRRPLAHRVGRVTPRHPAELRVPLRLVERQRRRRSPHRIRHRLRIRPEPSHQNPPGIVVDRSQQRRHLPQRIPGRAAIPPGMPILARRAQ